MADESEVARGDINEAPFAYWRGSGYSVDTIYEVGREIDQQWMFAIFHFRPGGELQPVLSSKTWERQEGHYPTLISVFESLARSSLLEGKTGSILVCLEDGMWPWLAHLSRRVPILCFGRSIGDTTSFLMPDPAYLSSGGYEEEIQRIKEAEGGRSFNDKRPTIFFRGAATGLQIETPDWSSTQRGRLCVAARDLGRPEVADAKLTRIGHLLYEQQKALGEAGVTGDVVPFEEFLGYRYLVDADGYSCAWQSLATKLASNSVVVKVLSDVEQWYYRDLVPWKHYVPLNPTPKELSDLHAWLTADDARAERIVAEAHRFVRERLSFPRVIDDTARLVSGILGLCRG